MKRIIAPVLLLIIMCFVSCKKNNADGTPPCVEDLITQLKKATVQNPPAQVYKWEDANATYFYVTSDCCDQYNNLYDTNCQYVCAPDGGFTGNGDGKCPAFDGEIKKTLIWEDQR